MVSFSVIQVPLVKSIAPSGNVLKLKNIIVLEEIECKESPQNVYGTIIFHWPTISNNAHYT